MNNKYEEKFKELFLQEIENNGYTNGFDFSLVTIQIRENKEFYWAGFESNRNIFYIPRNKGFHLDFELYIYKENNKIVRKDSTLMRFYPDSNLQEKVVKRSFFERLFSNNQTEIEYLDKGPYPGQNYFKAELNALDRSLIKHKPVIEFNRVKLGLEQGIALFQDRYTRIYQISDNILHIYFSVAEEVRSGCNVKFYYNVESGEVSALEFHCPRPLLI